MVQRRRRHRPGSALSSYPLDVRPIFAGEVVYVRTLSGPHQGLFTHFHRRSRYCTGEDCPPSLHRITPTWFGYEPVEEWDKDSRLWLPCVLQVTARLETCFRGKYDRGQVWELTRLPDEGKRHQPVEGKLVEECDPASWPSAWDMAPVLFTLYNQAVRLDQSNPLPPRTMVTPSAAPAPGRQTAEPERPPAELPPLAGRMLSEHNRRAGMANGTGH